MSPSLNQLVVRTSGTDCNDSTRTKAGGAPRPAPVEGFPGYWTAEGKVLRELKPGKRGEVFLYRDGRKFKRSVRVLAAPAGGGARMTWQTLLAVDFDRWATETYRANFPGVPVVCGPVADALDALPPADVIIGGPPCQPFSTAGEGKGDTDDRDCIPDFIAAVGKVRPRMFLMENVPGLMTERHIGYFGRAIDALEAHGYAVKWKLLDAVGFGVPQFRERVWVWGIRADVPAVHRWPRPTHAWPPPDPCMFGGALLPGVTVGQALGIDGHVGMPRNINERAGNKWHSTNEPSITIDTIGGTAARVMGGKRGGGPGHAMPLRDITHQPAQTIMHHQRQGNHAPVIEEYRWSDAMLAKHPPASPASPAPTVQAKWFKGGAEGLVEVVGGGTNPHYAGEDRTERVITDEPSTTIAAQHTHNALPGIRDGLRVRRLTPDECLRLQSGPDDFAWPAGITKTARYRVVGNGWACRMGAVFADAFALADPASRTVVDLFCGGGLGACGWHGRFWSREHPCGK